MWTGTAWVPMRLPQQSKPRLMSWDQWVLLSCVGAALLAMFLVWMWLTGNLDFVEDIVRAIRR